MKYPKYPAYKDSGVDWIGKVPREWKIKKLKSLTRIQTGITPPTDKSYYYSEELGFPWIKPDDIEESLYPSKASKYLSNEGSKIVKKIDAGSTIVCCIGTIGKLGYVDSVASTNQQINSVKSLSGNDKFIYFALAACKKEMESLASGNVIQILNKKKLGDIFVPLPSDLEMTNIADYLKTQVSKINKLADKIKNFIDVLKEKRQAVITKAVTKGLDQNVQMKDSGVEWIGEIPKHWTVMKVKHTSYVKGRVGWKGLTTDEYLEDGYAYLVTGQDFQSKTIIWDSCYGVDKRRYDDDPYIQLKNGDLLITKDGTIGKLAIVDGLEKPACLNSGILLVRPYDYYNTDFLYYVLSSTVFSNFYFLRSFGSTIQHLYQNVFEGFSFPIPPMEEQSKIVAYLERKMGKIDKIISTGERMVQLLKEYKTSLISQAVTGKIDVRGFSLPTTSSDALH